MFGSGKLLRRKFYHCQTSHTAKRCTTKSKYDTVNILSFNHKPMESHLNTSEPSTDSIPKLTRTDDALAWLSRYRCQDTEPEDSGSPLRPYPFPEGKRVIGVFLNPDNERLQNLIWALELDGSIPTVEYVHERAILGYTGKVYVWVFA